MLKIHLDFETYSEADLTKIGAYAYASHPSTDVLCASFDIGGELLGWRPGDASPFKDDDPKEIEIHAWNSQFERLIWQHVMVKRYGWPELRLEQFICTATQARLYAASPSKLDAAGQFFDRPHKKDRKGHLHMLKMCRPATEREQLDWHGRAHSFAEYGCDADHTREEHEYSRKRAAKRCHHTRANIDRLHDYCDQDVLTEMDIAAILPPWHRDDLEIFWTHERINDHGMIVDVQFAEAATEYAEDEKAYFNQRIAEITKGAVTTPRQFQRIKEWALPRMCEAAVEMTEKYEDGVKKNTFDADTRSNLLAEQALDPDFLDWDVAEFIEILDAAGKSTISKYEAIRNRAVTVDGRQRVQGLYMLAGAAQSARFSSTGLQAHNMVRDVPKTALRMIKAFKRRNRQEVKQAVAEWADAKNAKLPDGARRTPAEPVHALGALVRPTITGCPHGDYDLIWCDWSSIEACALPWLTMDPRADNRLEMFRRGEDVYSHTASTLTGRKITKADDFDRQAFGKVPDLSLGYCGGTGALFSMAKNYGVQMDEATASRTVRAWREANPWAMDFGRALEEAATNALRHPGSGFSGGRIEYVYDPDALDGIGCLYAYLPSCRPIPYPGARLEAMRTAWGKNKLGITAYKGAWRPKQGAEDWPRVGVWYGLLSENATQATCADLLMVALVRCRKAGMAVCMHTHDEIVAETDAPERDGPRLEKLMITKPGWPGDDALPIRAEWGAGYRYKVKFEED